MATLRWPAWPIWTIRPPPTPDNIARSSAGPGRSALQAYRLAGSGAIPLFLGGDHTLAMGSVNGVARYWQERGRELFLLWLDAHADYNTPVTTVTGNMHGMSAAFLCGEAGLDGLLGDEPRASLAPQQLELFGVRAIDRLERQLVQQRRIGIADMRRIDEFGVGVLLRDFLDRVQARNGVLHVSFDVDFLDPDLAPGVGTAVPGGATYREAHLVMEMLHDAGLVVAVDVVELNPFLDERGRTARIAVDLIGSLFGQQITERPLTSVPYVKGVTRGGHAQRRRDGLQRLSSVVRVMDQAPDRFGLTHGLAMRLVGGQPVAGVLFDQQIDQRSATHVVVGVGEQLAIAVDVKTGFGRTHVTAPV